VRDKNVLRFMPQSLTAIFIHLVFSTKNREPVLLPEILGKLHAYVAGTLNGMGCHSIQVGGIADHVHALFALSRTMALADVVKEIKMSTSKWIKENGRWLGANSFYWQAGYGAFSVSVSNLDAVQTYIKNQEEHHRKLSFQDEMRKFFKRHKTEYDERYVWD
jgi:REP element-mobilizing transposase RayT